LDALAAVLLGQRHRAHPRRRVADAAEADAEAVDRHALDHGRRAGLLLDRVLEVAVLERVLLEEAVGARRGVAPVQADRLLSPRAGEAELAPRRDLVTALAPGLREEGVHLLERQTPERVVLVDEDGERVDGRADRRRLVAVLLLERVDLRALHLARHRSELRGAVDEPLPST